MRFILTLSLAIGILYAVEGKDPSLQAHWSFDELSGAKANDLSGNGCIGIISAKVAWAQGKEGAALNFGDGRSFVYAKLPLNSESFTFSAWARPTAMPLKMPASICGRPGWSTDIGYTQQGNFYFEIFNTEKQPFEIKSPKTYVPSEWHHIAGAFDKANAKLTLHVDGELVAETSFKGTPFPYPDDFYIGCAKASSAIVPRWFTGDVDEVKVYTRALNSGDIKKEYLALKDFSGPKNDSRYGKVGYIDQPLWLDPPVEQLAPVDEKLIEKLKSQPQHTAKISIGKDGQPELSIDKAQTNFFGVDTFEKPDQSVYLTPFYDAGINIVNVSINISRSATMSNMRPYWTGRGTYDFQDVEKNLWRPLQSNPNAKIIVWIQTDPYQAWPEEHPDDIMRNERGEGLVADRHFLRYGTPTAQNERYAWSFFSEAFRDDMSETIKHLLADIEKSVPGRAVVAYLIGGATDAQLYHWQPPNFILAKAENWGDYSPVALKAWKLWLAEKYKSPEALSESWGVAVKSFDEVNPPPANDLVGGAFFHDPRKERKAMDWKRFITDGRLNLITHFAKVLKAYSSKETLVGICSGDSGSRRDLTTMEEFLRDPDIDFILHQPAYGQRLPPNIGGMNANLASITANGKIFVDDCDHPTWLAKPSSGSNAGAGIHHDASFHGWAKDKETLRSMWRRDFASLWANGDGALWNPVFGELWAYADPAVIDEMKFLVKTAKEIKPQSPSAPLAEMAVIYDEKAVDYLKGGITAQNEWVRMQQNEMLASGVPFGIYYLADLREGKVPPAKLYVLQNLMNFDKPTVDAIEKLKANGATLVFLRDSGYEQSFDNMPLVSKTVGMTLARIENAKTPPVRIETKHPLVSWDSQTIKAVATVKWPETAIVFGPFDKGAPAPKEADLQKISDELSLGDNVAKARKVTCKGGVIDLQALIGGQKKEARSAYVFFIVESAKAQETSFGGAADWWMQWWVNGEKVCDTTGPGNGGPDFSIKAHVFKVSLKEGRNIVAVRAISGSDGFLLAAGGPNELAAPKLFNPANEKISIGEYALTATDPEALCLATYPNNPNTGFALKDHGSWKSIFIGTRILSREMLSALAKEAGAWRLTDPGVVSSASENLIMLHPLKSGTFTVRLKKVAALEDCPPGNLKSESAKEHKLDLEAGQTYLLRLR